MIPTLLISFAFAGGPVVAVGNGLVAAPPEGLAKSDVAGAWVSVLADCLEESRPGDFAVVDRSTVGATVQAVRAEVGAIRELVPSVVVVSIGATEMGEKADPAAFQEQLSSVVGVIRASSGPSVLLVGMVSPTLQQLEWPDDVTARQAAVDLQTGQWNDVMAKVAASDDGVWHVDLWKGWPRSARQRGRLTQGGWGLTDPAHARVGAIICEEIMKNLGNGKR